MYGNIFHTVGYSKWHTPTVASLLKRTTSFSQRNPQLCCMGTLVFDDFCRFFNECVILRLSGLYILYIFTSVFHRILDFNTGLDFYPGPFSFLTPLSKYLPIK